MLAGVAVWLSGSAQQPRNALKQPLAPSIVAQLDPQQAPASWEGGEQRCFQDVYFCGQKIELARGAPREHEAVWSEAERTAALAKAVPIEPFSYGQAVVQHETQQLRQGQAAEDGISLQAAEAAAAAKPQQEQRSKSSGRLKVLLMKRGGEGRQILNADELLERCNAWQYRAPNGTATADCREVRLRWGLAMRCCTIGCTGLWLPALRVAAAEPGGGGGGGGAPPKGAPPNGAPPIPPTPVPCRCQCPTWRRVWQQRGKQMCSLACTVSAECRVGPGAVCLAAPAPARRTGALVLQGGRPLKYCLPSSHLPARSPAPACLQAPTWPTAG